MWPLWGLVDGEMKVGVCFACYEWIYLRFWYQLFLHTISLVSCSYADHFWYVLHFAKCYLYHIWCIVLHSHWTSFFIIQIVDRTDDYRMQMKLFHFFLNRNINEPPLEWEPRVYSSKVGDLSLGWLKGSLFKSYNIEVLGRALLHSLDCYTLPLILILWCWVVASSTIFFF